MYIETHFYQQLRSSKVKARQRHLTYYQDLHKRYNIALNEAALMQGGQRCQALCAPIFDWLNSNNQLQQINTFILAQWTQAFDPDYATLGPYLSSYYQFSPKMFDVLDQGSLCLTAALTVLHGLAPTAGKTLVICLEQSKNALIDKNHSRNPQHHVAAALILSLQQTNHALKLIAARIIHHPTQHLQDDLLALLQQYEINPANCCVCIQKENWFFKTYETWLLDLQIAFQCLPQGVSSTTLLSLIKLLCEQSLIQQHYVIFIDQDVESDAIGIVILKK